MRKIYVMLVLRTEAATRGVLWKKVLLKISQNLQENTCARVYTLKKGILERVFSCQFYEIFKNTFFHKTPPVAASVRVASVWKNLNQPLERLDQ